MRQVTNGVCAEHVVYICTFLRYVKGILIFRRVHTVSNNDFIFIILAVRIEKFGSYSMDPHDVIYSKIFGKSFEKIQIRLLYV
jgi:hypothetical protein